MWKLLQLFDPQTPYRSLAPGPHWGLLIYSCIKWQWVQFSIPLCFSNEVCSAPRPRNQRYGFMTTWIMKKLVPICLYSLKCTKFGQLILRKLITRCQILRLKFTKFDFGWSFAQTLPGKLTALPQTLCIYGRLLLTEGRGRTSRGREGRREKGKEKGKGREGMEGTQP